MIINVSSKFWIGDKVWRILFSAVLHFERLLTCFFFQPPPVNNEPPSETNVVSPKNNGEIDQGSSPSNSNPADNEVIMNRKGEDRTTSFFAQPGILAGKHRHWPLDSCFSPSQISGHVHSGQFES